MEQTVSSQMLSKKQFSTAKNSKIQKLTNKKQKLP